MSLNTLTIDIVKRLHDIFIRNKWINVSETADSNYDDIFDSYCEMLTLLSAEEQQLILDLTQDFKYYPHSMYSSLLTKALDKIPADYLSSFENIFIAPMKDPLDADQVKSDSAVMYLCKHSIIKKFNLNSVDACDKLETLANTVLTRKRSLIIFTDDFIGTGDTAIEAFNAYLNGFAATDDEAIVIALVAQATGLSCIQNYGISAYNAVTIAKGISESTRIVNKAQALDIMDKIERRLKISHLYRRGYKASEALVSLIRTPDNTFPVFWSKERIGKDIWPAPFYR